MLKRILFALLAIAILAATLYAGQEMGQAGYYNLIWVRQTPKWNNFTNNTLVAKEIAYLADYCPGNVFGAALPTGSNTLAFEFMSSKLENANNDLDVGLLVYVASDGSVASLQFTNPENSIYTLDELATILSEYPNTWEGILQMCLAVGG